MSSQSPAYYYIQAIADIPGDEWYSSVQLRPAFGLGLDSVRLPRSAVCKLQIGDAISIGVQVLSHKGECPTLAPGAPGQEDEAS
jgi:hypothetical protein